jgi:integrase
MYKENPARKGFLDDDQYTQLARQCNREGLWFRALLTTAYSFAFRKGELLNLRVRQVDLASRQIRLDAGTTKNDEGRIAPMTDEVFTLSYERGCQVKKLLPAPLRDAGVVTYIQPYLIPHLILRGVIGLVALARRTFPRRCQPQLLVPTRRFHEVSGARRRSVPKLRKLKRWLKCQP